MEDLTFIETQFPIARLSAEAYKERKSGSSQTLTGLGKWWGRKPLILVRASILGMLMPASSDAKRDREIFLKILTMDDEGVWGRCKGAILIASWREVASKEQLEKYFSGRSFKRGTSDEEKEKIKKEIWDGLSSEEKVDLDNKKRRAITDRDEFESLTYAEKISGCHRPENANGPSLAAWDEINAHLGTSSNSLTALIGELGLKRFNHIPRVGDAFCGGGSIPFEANRIGCESYGSDLNPVATLLTWGGINILGSKKKDASSLLERQKEIYALVDSELCELGVEHNKAGERAEAFLYCVELTPEGCDYPIPISASWVVSEKYRAAIKWSLSESGQLLPCAHHLSKTEIAKYGEESPTFREGRIIDPLDNQRSWSIAGAVGPDSIRLWEKHDLVPRESDIFQERLYCIRWINKDGERRFAAPTIEDIEREAEVLKLLRENLEEWQNRGFIPSAKMPVEGQKTQEPIRTRGWTYWHHLFTPRQLYMHGLIASKGQVLCKSKIEKVYNLLTIGYIADNSSRLCGWNSHSSKGPGNIRNVFSNQALNTLYNFGTKAFSGLRFDLVSEDCVRPELRPASSSVKVVDARNIIESCDIWITDPPYADAINYHELADFFLSWYQGQLQSLFPEWEPVSRPDLAVKGSGDDFRRSMVQVYSNLASNMPDNGMQMVMFTHQDPAVWADLGMILWAAGLKATAAWTISTETEAAGIKKGNYVQGTVCLVLRKRVSAEPGFLDEVYPLVEDEVKQQIASMQALDEDGEPNFNDADYQLAAYAAALKVLTQYATLDGREVEHEVFAVRDRKEKSDFQTVIERALEISCDALVPKGLEILWRDLSLVERYYLRALDIESRGERRKGMYEELARGFGLSDIRPLLKSDKANGARMHTGTGFGEKGLVGLKTEAKHPFASSPLRHLLYAIRETGVHELSPEPARQYLYDTFGAALYWQERERLIGLLDWLAALGNAEGMQEWANDSEASRILAGRLRNDEG